MIDWDQKQGRQSFNLIHYERLNKHRVFKTTFKTI